MSATPQHSTALAQLQRSFIARLRGEPDGDLQHEVDVGRVSREVGLRIYGHAYASRLREALENDHAVLGGYLGDALWGTLCTGYIAAHPSRVRSLRDFGNALPEYLTHAEAFRGHPQIAELARFERLLLDSFDAADDPCAAWATLLARPADTWPTLRPRFHSSLRLHHARHGSVEIWRAIKAGHAPPGAGASGPSVWLLWRDAERVGRFRSLDRAEAAALACCRDGGHFAELCELLAITRAADAVPAIALGYLQAWCDEGWVSDWG